MKRILPPSALLLIVAHASAQDVQELIRQEEIESSLFLATAPDVESLVRDEESLLVLGKALFFDEQVGSDGRVACATCHFAAGADHRTRGTVHPGPDGVLEVARSGRALRRQDFPIRADDVIGSQGVLPLEFNEVIAGEAPERSRERDGVAARARSVTARNAPSVINSAFAGALFWDGRAVAGGDDFLLWSDGDEGLRREAHRLNSPIAHQSLGPVVDDGEMSFRGRSLMDVGKKLLPLRPLALQEVHAEDGVLGTRRAPDGTGLEGTYLELARKAFHPRLWESDACFDGEGAPKGRGPALETDEYTLAEVNFGVFFATSLLAYQRTLVSDDSKFDRVLREGAELSPVEAFGFELFVGKACCAPCHVPPEWTAASLREAGNPLAFANTGLRPIEEDAGRVDGRFKTPSLRNVELTGPYFHNGSRATLRQVVDFYDLGGEYATGATNHQVQPIGLSEDEKVALVHFLLTLTDERVRSRAAPFDGPSLSPPNGPRIAATGRSGGSVVQPFLGLSPFER